jgi:hypothetical protein
LYASLLSTIFSSDQFFREEVTGGSLFENSRSFIVVTQKIEAVTPGSLEVKGEEIPIDKMYRSHTLKVLVISQ